LNNRASQFFLELQETICRRLEEADGAARFRTDRWNHAAGGGGITRVLEGGALFEKAGVNYSAVSSTLTERLAKRLNTTEQSIFATGISIVLHPLNPYVPTVHFNTRYLELESGTAWFGGGTDLTPWYLFEDDTRHFHATLKAACDRHDASYYPKFKKQCDEYFYLPHRKETRGVGGIFFDYLKGNFDTIFALVQDVGNSFLDSYLPIVAKRKAMPWGATEKEWQLIRRGRYVEFNLLYDRGTLFGLETGGRTESILMSLPPDVKWAYDFTPVPDSPEEKLLGVLQHPREWV